MTQLTSRVWRDGELVASDIPLSELDGYLADAGALTWLDLCDPEGEVLSQLAEELRARGEVKGEIALVIAPPSEDEEAGIVPVGAAAADPDEALREDIRAALEEGEPASAVAKRLSQKYSRRKRDVYAMVLDMQ